MANTRIFSRSFAGGIISPEMFGRIDDAKFQTGCAILRNFIATPQGPAENRPGFAFVKATKNNGVARLIPFTYSSDQTMVVEAGEQYFRFHTQGETLLQPLPSTDPYEITTPYHVADLFGIHYVQSADVMTLVHPLYPPMELRRLGATNWQLTPIQFAPAIATPTSVAVTPSPGFKTNISSVAIASSNALITTSTNHTLSVGDQIYIANLNAFVSGVLTDFSGYFVVEDVPVDSSGNLIKNQLHVQDYNGNPLNTATWSSWHPPSTIQLANKSQDPYSHYAVTATAANGIDESVLSVTVNALNNLDVPGSFNTITWAAVPGAVRYTVYKQRNGLFGYIGETTALQFVDDNISADFSITPPYYESMFAGPGDYPGAVCYYEQRRVFAGTLNQPENLWMSNSGTESTFSYSLPTKATDRVAIKVAAREANTIRHLVPLTRLIPMTSAAEWAVVPVGADAITPTSISVQPQSYVGSNNVQPSIVNNLMVFAAARGGHVRELGYKWEANSFVTGDLSLRATQLFDNMTLVDMAFGKAPRPLLWFVSSSGVLLGLTYVPEEQIGAWHLHDTDGDFESVCCVAEGTEDYLYAVIRRQVNGATVRYVERMASRLVSSAPTNLLYNPTFDSGTAGWDFQIVAGGSWSLVGSSPWGAGNMAQWFGSGTAAVSNNKQISLTPGQMVQATCEALGEVGATGGTLRITFYTAAGVYISGVSTPAPAIAIWQPVTITGIAPPGSGYALVDFAVTGETGTGRWFVALFDASYFPIAPRATSRAESIHMDAALTYYGAPATTISGLDHLEGKQVAVLADGAVIPGKTVQSGAITLDHPASLVTVGLPYTCDLQTLPLLLQVDGYGQGRSKNINKAWIRVWLSSGIFIGPDAAHLTEAKQRTTEPYGSPPTLQTDEIMVMTTPQWQQSGQILIRQTYPLPLTVVSLTMEVSLGG